LVSRGAVFLQASLDHQRETRRYGANGRERRRGLLNDLGRQLDQLISREGRSPREKLEQRHADRPDVGAPVDGLGSGELLWRHVLGRAEDGTRARHRLAGRRLGALRDTEVEDLRLQETVTTLDDEEVGGLEIPMDDAERVSFGDRLARLDHELDGLLDKQRAPGAQPVGEITPVEMLHHEVRRTVVEASNIEHARDVLTLDFDGRPRFAFEAEQGLGAADPLR
jgi:hypothetical protein